MNAFQRSSVAIATLLVAVCFFAQAAAFDSSNAAKIDSILKEQQQALHLPGLAFAIVENDRIAYLKAFGLRDIEAGLPMTTETVLPIGSCTKAFTSFLVAVAQEQGRLSLDDPPRKFLPWFHMADPEADAGITLRDMLSHRTGLRAKADLASEPAVLNLEEFVRAATSAKPAIKFRSGFQYSNSMYCAVGLILSKVYGTTWENAVEQQILRPLGMKSTFTSPWEGLKSANHAVGYSYDDSADAWKRVSPPESLETLAPAGAIASTATDMSQWLRMLTSGGLFASKKFVSDKTFREITHGINPINDSLTYALGWVIYDWNGHSVVEHNGGSEGISALVSFMPEKHLGFVLLSNTSPNFMTQIGNAGNLIWPVLLNEKAPSVRIQTRNEQTTPSAQPQSNENLPETTNILKRMIEASGGEKNLKRHISLQIEAVKSYENQGITADLQIRANAPAKREESEKWYAAGRDIGRLRLYFDGTRGGQETTFGQDAIYKANENEQALRDSSFHLLLDIHKLYEDVEIIAKTNVEGEDCYLLRLNPGAGKGTELRLYVSIATGLVFRRESEGQTITYRDYRDLDREMIPYETKIEDALGETLIKIKSARFNITIPDSAFESQR